MQNIVLICNKLIIPGDSLRRQNIKNLKLHFFHLSESPYTDIVLHLICTEIVIHQGSFSHIVYFSLLTTITAIHRQQYSGCSRGSAGATLAMILKTLKYVLATTWCTTKACSDNAGTWQYSIFVVTCFNNYWGPLIVLFLHYPCCSLLIAEDSPVFRLSSLLTSNWLLFAIQVDCQRHTDAMFERSQRNPGTVETKKLQGHWVKNKYCKLQLCGCAVDKFDLDVQQVFVRQTRPKERSPQSLRGARKWPPNGFLEKKITLATWTRPPLTGP